MKISELIIRGLVLSTLAFKKYIFVLQLHASWLAPTRLSKGGQILPVAVLFFSRSLKTGHSSVEGVRLLFQCSTVSFYSLCSIKWLKTINSVCFSCFNLSSWLFQASQHIFEYYMEKLGWRKCPFNCISIYYREQNKVCIYYTLYNVQHYHLQHYQDLYRKLWGFFSLQFTARINSYIDKFLQH